MNDSTIEELEKQMNEYKEKVTDLEKEKEEMKKEKDSFETKSNDLQKDLDRMNSENLVLKVYSFQ